MVIIITTLSRYCQNMESAREAVAEVGENNPVLLACQKVFSIIIVIIIIIIVIIIIITVITIIVLLSGLGTGFGLLTLTRGLAAMSGPPLAGLVVDR